MMNKGPEFELKPGANLHYNKKVPDDPEET
jgi:hypothetical protein